MRIFSVQYHAEPLPGSEEFETCGGAYVNCWIEATSADAALKMTSATVADSGWTIVSVEEECVEVTEDSYADDEEGLEYFRQAVSDGECYVFYEWPLEPQQGDEIH